MKYTWLALFVLYSVCVDPVFSHAVNTHGTPSMQREMQAWFGDASGSYLVSGGLHGTTSGTLTSAAFATEAYIPAANGELVYVSQAAQTVTYTASSTSCLAIHADTFAAVAGWIRQGVSHYLRQASACSTPPTDGMILAQVTTTTEVTAVELLAPWVITTAQTIAADLTVGAAGRLLFTDGGSLSIDNGVTVTVGGQISAPVTAQIFTLTGSGAITWSAEHRQDQVYPQWWGAFGDNTDDTAAWDAIILAVTDGPKLYIPGGTYLTDGTQSSFTGGLSIECEGWNSVLRGLRLLTTGPSADILIRHCLWEDGNTPMEFTDASRVRILHNYFDNTTPLVGSTPRGIVLYDSTDVVIDGNTFIDHQFGIWLQSIAAGPNRHVRITNNHFENTQDYVNPVAVNIAEGQFVTIANNTVKDITDAAGTVSYAFYQGDNVSNSSFNITYTGNVIEGTEFGFRNHSASEVTYTGNTFLARTPDLAQTCMLIDGDADPIDASVQENITITGNLCEGRINLAQEVEHVTIAGNTIDGSTTTGLRLAGTDATTRPRYITITGNTIHNTDDSCIYITQAEYVTISGNILIDCNVDNAASGANMEQNAGVGIATAVWVSITDNLIGNVAATGNIEHAINIGSLANAVTTTYHNNSYIDIDSTTIRQGHTTAPATGTWEDGAIVYNALLGPSAPVLGWVNVAGGTPGTWAAINTIRNGGDPPATCNVGELYMDTDETNDTNCTTTADNSLCLCTATDTWTALENN